MKKGTHHSLESRAKISRSMKLLPTWNDGSERAKQRIEQCRQMGMIYGPRPKDAESNKKRSESQLADKHWNWTGGHKETENDKLRHRKAYKNWRNSVIERDKKCVVCGSTENLQADHLKGFAFYPELRYEPSNGRTICYECHKQTHSWGRKTEVIAQYSMSY